ncbi:MAG: hypothetical protein Q9163_002443 [Psora crenata]
MFGGKPKRRIASKQKHSKPKESEQNSEPGEQQALQAKLTAQPHAITGSLLAATAPAPSPWHRQPSASHIYGNNPAAANASKLQALSPGPEPPHDPPSIRTIPDLPTMVGSSWQDASRTPGAGYTASLEEMAQGALSDLICKKLDDIITAIDSETFTGDERDLEQPQSGLRGGWGSKTPKISGGANKAISSALVSTNYFAKASLYANSTLPPNLPPLKLYLPSYPLLCLAAQYSERAYTKPAALESEAFVPPDWRLGTKAMVIKSIPIADMNCVVFAIRGTQTFMDWAVNLNSAPVSPSDFLDDPGNLCHSGFLSVARKMIKPVAARLRSLLEEDPSRTTCSLLMTGHSAGGAIASLLYAHMLAENARSELNILTGCFKRIHCITFGTPPISLLPLTKPTSSRYKKCLFMSFINEGDPVPRADKAYIRSLLHLYASPAPGSSCVITLPGLKQGKWPSRTKRSASAPVLQSKDWIWEVPPGALSNAGRLVVLRGKGGAGISAGAGEDVEAVVTGDQQLRGVVFGDPVMHMMKIYARRVEGMATRAVTGRAWG